ALYPGSFDPVTLGHLDLVARARRMFDSVTVAVARNSSKNPVFSVEERIELLRAELPGDVEVVGFSELVVEFAAREGYDAILRGLRNIGDFEFEYQMALTNRHLKPDIETVFVMPSHAYSYVSSSLIKDIVRFGGDVSSFVPARVAAAMRAKLEG
ncbi:MAG: pantetheine-phosphate adenylyltransferase, partial [Planctomycetota bacterium]|nr:pantetheine-phosphate adenylyltransferase [Planctomycetota bacterium]